MSKLYSVFLIVLFLLCVGAGPAFADGQIIISIEGNCRSIGISNVVQADVFLNGALRQAGVTGIGIYVPPGSHDVQVNGYCFDIDKKVARNLGIWRKTIKIKDNEVKRYRAKF